MVLYNTNNQVINELDFTSMGADGTRHDAFICEYCLEMFFEDYTDLVTIAKEHRDQCKSQFSTHQNGILKIDSKTLNSFSAKEIEIINRMGSISGSEHTRFKLTYLPDPTWDNQTIYLYIKEQKPIGLLNMGFEYQTGSQSKIYCIDFFIIKPFQRLGFGKRLFNCMMKDIQVEPVMLYYQRPSAQFIGFLKKHFDVEAKDIIRWG